jgi:hypothetical protein
MASNGKAAPAGVVVPEIKFTKLFINGEFVAAASGTHKYTYMLLARPPHCSVALIPFFLLHSQL